jgi:heme/copper-type cytochrome/quinol oxidase subunit 2
MPQFRSRASLLSCAQVAVVLAAGLGGCGNSGEVTESAPESSAPSTSPSATTPAPATSGTRVIEVRIADGAVQTDADRVEVAAGQSVRVVVTSDVDDELHVHGVDETVDLVAGETTTLDVIVDEPGVFDVETHEGGLLLFQLVVR